MASNRGRRSGDDAKMQRLLLPEVKRSMVTDNLTNEWEKGCLTIKKALLLKVDRCWF